MDNLATIGREHIMLSGEEIQPVTTSHMSGSKQVFSFGSTQPVVIKQIALGKLEPGEIIAAHTHPDLDEYYYFISGNGEVRVNENIYNVKPGDFLLITAGSEHELVAGGEPLSFYYQSFELYSDQKNENRA
jgi:quercetin dioxygenase-like cupin family protein